jgi:hypothetical protein
MVTIVYPTLADIFPHSMTDEPLVIKLAVSHLMRLPAPNYAVTVDASDSRNWILWLSDASFKYLQQITH